MYSTVFWQQPQLGGLVAVGDALILNFVRLDEMLKALGFHYHLDARVMKCA